MVLSAAEQIKPASSQDRSNSQKQSLGDIEHSDLSETSRLKIRLRDWKLNGTSQSRCGRRYCHCYRLGPPSLALSIKCHFSSIASTQAIALVHKHTCISTRPSSSDFQKEMGSIRKPKKCCWPWVHFEPQERDEIVDQSVLWDTVFVTAMWWTSRTILLISCSLGNGAKHVINYWSRFCLFSSVWKDEILCMPEDSGSFFSPGQKKTARENLSESLLARENMVGSCNRCFFFASTYMVANWYFCKEILNHFVPLCVWIWNKFYWMNVSLLVSTFIRCFMYIICKILYRHSCVFRTHVS